MIWYDIRQYLFKRRKYHFTILLKDIGEDTRNSLINIEMSKLQESLI